jgi:hypothetical protein
MGFLIEQDVKTKKDKKDVIVFHNSQVFFRDIVEVLSNNLSAITQEKLVKFLEFYIQHVNSDRDIKFLTMGDKNIVAVKEGRIVYYTNSKKIRIYIGKEVE